MLEIAARGSLRNVRAIVIINVAYRNPIFSEKAEFLKKDV
jgi:hypothetical protein